MRIEGGFRISRRRIVCSNQLKPLDSELDVVGTFYAILLHRVTYVVAEIRVSHTPARGILDMFPGRGLIQDSQPRAGV